MNTNSPGGEKYKVSLSNLDGKSVFAHWFDLRSGSTTEKAKVERINLSSKFVPPSKGTDWFWCLKTYSFKRWSD